jgi:hypothetical protein
VARTRDALWRLMGRQLADLRLAVLMLDGIEIKGRMSIVALGISTEGDKLALGLWAGTTRTRPSLARCSQTSSHAGLTSSRACCSSSTGLKRLQRSRELAGVEETAGYGACVLTRFRCDG